LEQALPTPAAAPTVPKSGDRYAYLDAIRGVAAMMVLLQHALEQAWPWFRDFTTYYVNFGQLGVCVFFLVSGYIIPHSLEKTNDLRSFWIRRFFRLFPLYWACLFAAIVFGRLGWYNTHDFDPANWNHILKNTTMLQAFLKAPHAVAVFWTLGVEMIFYILASILFALKVNQRTLLVTLGVAALFAAAGIVAPLVLDRRLSGTGSLFMLLTAFLGWCTFRWEQGKLRKEAVAAVAAVILGLGAGTALMMDRLPSPGGEDDRIKALAIFFSWAGAYAFFFAVYRIRTRHMPGFFSWLGLISYSLYLSHPFILDNLMHKMDQKWVAAGLTVVLCTFSAWATYHLIEKPSIDWGRAVDKRFARKTT